MDAPRRRPLKRPLIPLKGLILLGRELEEARRGAGAWAAVAGAGVSLGAGVALVAVGVREDTRRMRPGGVRTCVRVIKLLRATFSWRDAAKLHAVQIGSCRTFLTP